MDTEVEQTCAAASERTPQHPLGSVPSDMLLASMETPAADLRASPAEADDDSRRTPIWHPLHHPTSTLRPIAAGRCIACLTLMDALAAAAASLLGVAVRFGGERATIDGIPYLALAAVLPACWLLMVMLSGGYDRRCLAVGVEEYRRVGNAGVWLLAGLALMSYVTSIELSRVFVAFTVPMTTLLSLTGRHAARKVLHRRLARGRSLHRVIVMGSVAEVHDLIRYIHRVPYAGFNVLGACVPGQVDTIELPNTNVPVLGTAASVIDAVRRSGANMIAVAGGSTLAQDELRRLSWQLEGTGIDLVVAPAITDIAGPRIFVRPIQGLPLLHIQEPEFSGIQRLLKALVDRLAAILLLITLSPLLLAIAAAVRLDSGGSAFFNQVRVGWHGRRFVLWKFRTMYDGADREYRELSRLNDCDGCHFKIRSDPRVTPLGRWLRRFSLDELPQLWNVLKGSMSLVGPRPPVPSEAESFGDDARRRLLVKPGMTGLWQVSGRSDLSWEESVRLDLYYVENWSVAMDVMLLWKTVGAVLRARGAY
jgi:exopolysaccharide biosynthesis polyprenyl glycosylphosphotransferase